MSRDNRTACGVCILCSLVWDFFQVTPGEVETQNAEAV